MSFSPAPELDLSTTPLSTNDSFLVYFDVETSGFGDAEVIQIAALSGDNLFSAYILPSYIDPRASDTHGLTLSEDGGSLLLRGNAVETTPRTEAWEGFVNHLQKLEKEIVLVGHNIRFDLRCMLEETETLGLFSHISRLVVGYVDTMNVFKETLPGLENHKQTTIAYELEISTDNAHNAVNDVEMSKKLLRHVSEETVKKHQCTFVSFLARHEENRVRSMNALSLRGLLGPGISRYLINKMAGAGVNMARLMEVYSEGGEDGVRLLLCSRPRDGKALLTRNQDVIINHIIAHLNSY